jgi:glycine dehydrogenase
MGEADVKEMLKVVKTSTIDSLMTETIPADVYNQNQLREEVGKLPVANDLLHKQFKTMLQQNKQYKIFLGEGFYPTIVPPVIERCFLSNPGWYTAYTPYQAEISQGRLTALLIFQEMTRCLTGLEVAGASLLDEASAASEAMILSWNHTNKKGKRFLVDQDVYDASFKVINTVAEPLGIEVVRTRITADSDLDGVFGVLFQNPDNLGRVRDLTDVIKGIKEAAPSMLVSVGCDFASLMLVKSPGEMGADIAYGNAQRFGVPMGFGGPAAAFFSCTSELMRKLPGRIVGMSKDSQGNPAIRMALQTREQHIRREKATSNICTAQALLANMSGFYAVYHREAGLKTISERIHYQAQLLAKGLEKLGLTLVDKSNFFDTVVVSFKTKAERDAAYAYMLKKEHNLRRIGDNMLASSCDETKTVDDITTIIQLFAEHLGKQIDLKPLLSSDFQLSMAKNTRRVTQGRILDNDIFHQIQGEHEMMRFLKHLENQDISLTKSMITLGSCTMKLNSAVEMIPLTWPELNVHPYVPADQALGYKAMIDELSAFLCSVTSFDAMSFNSNSGAAGEYAGLLAIRGYFKSKGQNHRNLCLIPASAHGTNPASAIKAGFEVRIVASDPHGNIDLVDLKAKCEQYKDNLSCFMVTYPSTHGVYEDTIRKAIDMIHAYGGQVYLDGANMNAQVGLTSPGFLGADVCHLNLHKTFCIPHGGGGPGMGPIGVKKHLAPFTPSLQTSAATGPISSSEYSSASILSISYLYMKAMGNDGLRNATKFAILNANYMANRLKDHYKVLFSNQNGRVAHEFILDIRDIKKISGIGEEDIAKRLVDYGFHSPTMSFPVGGTLMIEPTESENKEELDRFCDALIKIREEIRMVEQGKYDPIDNPLKNAPHTAEMVMSDTWDHKYKREEAAYPLPWVKARGKYWPPVSRVNNVYGDKHLVVSLPKTRVF